MAAQFNGSGTALLDIEVNALYDWDSNPITFLQEHDISVEILYATPISTPIPTPDPTETPVPTPDPTPTPMPENMTVALELPTSAAWGGTNHWIPNTGEDFGPFRVKITAESSTGGNFSFIGDFESFDILPPLDDNFDSGEIGDSNIKTNKGACQYYVYAWQTNENPVLIKIFRLNSGIMTSAARYETFFSVTGANLKADTGGYLYYDYNGTIYNYFTINAETGTGTIRPGDDLRFRFGLVYYPEFNEMVGDEGFMAVYDKKMLWRANAYIDETKNEDGTASGNTDWNNINKWTATNGNTWDTAGDGGQCVIRPWTRPYDENNLLLFGMENTSVFDAVAYSGGCSDTVMHFNQDLDLQAEALTANGEPANRNNKTLAPALDWDNYITGDYVAGSNPALWTAPTIGGSIRYPHRPVLTSVTGKNYNGTVLGYTTTQLGYSAGIDCYGHVQRIASYSGNQYRLRDFSVTDNQGDGDRLEWGQDNSTRFESLVGIREDSWLI